MALDTTKVFASHLARCNIINTVYANCTHATTGYIKLLDNMQTLYEGKRIAVSENYALGLRERESLNISAAAGMLQSSWQDLMEVMNRVDNASESLRYLECYNYMHANSIYFLSRGMTVTAATVGTGKGTLKHVDVDANGYGIEYSAPGTFLMTCESQVNLSDLPGREKWRIIPQDSGIDWIDFYNKPRMQQGYITTWDSERNSLLANPSFGAYTDAGTGTTATIGTLNTAITDWTMLGTITDLFVQRDVYYTHDSRSGTNYSYGNALGVVSTKTTGSVGMIQTIKSKLGTEYPYYAAIKFYRASTAVQGTLALSVGTIGASAVMTDYATGAWHSLELPQDTACWYENFAPTTNGYVTYQWLFSPTTDNGAVLYLDHASFHPFDRFGNQFMSMEQGQTDFTYNDTCAYTVTYGTTGNRQRNEAVLNNRYYPHTTVATTALADS